MEKKTFLFESFGTSTQTELVRALLVSHGFTDAMPFGRLWYGEPDVISNAIGYAKFRSRSHDAVIHVYDEAGNVIETHEHAGDFKQW
jgi:hypothetical protein